MQKVLWYSQPKVCTYICMYTQILFIIKSYMITSNEADPINFLIPPLFTLQHLRAEVCDNLSERDFTCSTHQRCIIYRIK